MFRIIRQFKAFYAANWSEAEQDRQWYHVVPNEIYLYLFRFIMIYHRHLI